MYIYACASDLPNLPEAHSSLPRKRLSVAHKSGPMFWPKAMVPSKHKLHTYIHMSDSTDVPRTGVCVWHIHINYVFSSVQFRPPVSPRAFISVASKLANTLIASFCCGLRATHTHTHTYQLHWGYIFEVVCLLFSPCSEFERLVCLFI